MDASFCASETSEAPFLYFGIFFDSWTYKCFFYSFFLGYFKSERRTDGRMATG